MVKGATAFAVVVGVLAFVFTGVPAAFAGGSTGGAVAYGAKSYRCASGKLVHKVKACRENGGKR